MLCWNQNIQKLYQNRKSHTGPNGTKSFCLLFFGIGIVYKKNQQEETAGHFMLYLQMD